MADMEVRTEDCSVPCVELINEARIEDVMSDDKHVRFLVFFEIAHNKTVDRQILVGDDRILRKEHRLPK